MMGFAAALVLAAYVYHPVPFPQYPFPPPVGLAPPDHSHGVHPKFIRENEFRNGHWELHFEPAK